MGLPVDERRRTSSSIKVLLQRVLGIKDDARGIVRRFRSTREGGWDPPSLIEQRKFPANFGNPWSSKRRVGTLDSLPSVVFQQRFSSFFFSVFFFFHPLPSFVRRRRFRAANERTAKIKVRLSSQYCERGTNEIRAASGRISSFELARNSSRLYLPGTGETTSRRKGEEGRGYANRERADY